MLAVLCSAVLCCAVLCCALCEALLPDTSKPVNDAVLLLLRSHHHRLSTLGCNKREILYLVES